MLLDLSGKPDAESRRQLHLGERRLQVLGNRAEVAADRVGGDMDDALEVFSLDLYGPRVQLQRRQVFEEHRLSVLCRQQHIFDGRQVLAMFVREPGADVVFIAVLGVGEDDRIGLAVAVQ